MIKTLTAKQNQSCYNEFENLKQQMNVRLQMISFTGGGANIVIILGVNGA